jgi:DNA helicase-2/ATP-dependent DNA helicase PcrA
MSIKKRVILLGIGPGEMAYEKKRLDTVLKEASRQLKKYENIYVRFRKQALNTQKSMRHEISLVGGDLDDVANIWQYQTDIQRLGMNLKYAGKQVKRLQRILDGPYFGRIDFLEDGKKEIEKIYIGILNLVDEKTGEYLVYDWRAPVCSMFYDFEVGNAFYMCPAGKIHGEILLKRQYRIKSGKLVFAIESSLKIDDEILQEILAGSADSKMKTIVASIQKEQNRAIRNEDEKILIVIGPAGSGKTSVALHRAAYLLYRHRDTLRPEDILIYSPNRIFSDYISNVLPELGEENVNRITFNELASGILGAGYKLESPNRLMEYLLGGKSSQAEKNEIKRKCSHEFLKRIVGYVKFLENEGFKFSDIYFNNRLVISKGDIERQYYEELRFLPVIKRLRKIKGRILFLLSKLETERSAQIRESLEKSGQYYFKEELRFRCIKIVTKELEPVKKLIDDMTSYNVFDAYKEIAGELLPERYATQGTTPESVSIRCEDIAPIVLLKVMLEGINYHTRHVIVDEVQDYSVVQMEVLRRVYPHARFTMLGDVNQLINPLTGNASTDILQELLYKDAKPGMIKLNKTYRATKEITDFCNAIIDSEAEVIDRRGVKPVVKTGLLMDAMAKQIVDAVDKARSQGYVSIAVICRTARQTYDLYNDLPASAGIRLIRSEDDEFTAGAVILPSYLAKGLEFDVVLVVSGKGDYDSSIEKNLFYTVCSRALHVLGVLCDDPPGFISGMDKSQYQC